MTREVTLSIRGLHGAAEAERAGVDVLVAAEYFKRNGSHYLLYEELVGEGSKTSSLQGSKTSSLQGSKTSSLQGSRSVCRNRLRISEGRVELIRRGTIDTRMVFEQNKIHRTDYTTPYGSLPLEIRTGRIRLEELEDRILVTVEYELEMGEAPLGESTIRIEIRPGSEDSRLRDIT